MEPASERQTTAKASTLQERRCACFKARLACGGVLCWRHYSYQLPLPDDSGIGIRSVHRTEPGQIVRAVRVRCLVCLSLPAERLYTNAGLPKTKTGTLMRPCHTGHGCAARSHSLALALPSHQGALLVQMNLKIYIAIQNTAHSTLAAFRDSKGAHGAPPATQAPPDGMGFGLACSGWGGFVRPTPRQA